MVERAQDWFVRPCVQCSSCAPALRAGTVPLMICQHMQLLVVKSVYLQLFGVLNRQTEV